MSQEINIVPFTLNHIDSVSKKFEYAADKGMLKDLKKGKLKVDNDVATRLALTVLAHFPEYTVKSVLNVFDIDTDATGFGMLADRMREEIISKTADEIVANREKKDKEDVLAVQDGSEEPVPDSILDMHSRYNTYYSFASRNKQTRYGSSEAKLASMALVLFGQNACLRLEETGNWLTWNGHVWTEGDNGHVRNHVDKMAKLIEADIAATEKENRKSSGAYCRNILHIRYGLPSEVKRSTVDNTVKAELEKMRLMVSRLESANTRDNVIRLMGDSLLKSIKNLDCNQDEVVFKNTAWNAVTNTFYPNRTTSLATRSVDRNWVNPSTQAVQNWTDYINGLGFDSETLTFLQRSFGYTMLGRGTAKRFWWFRGDTNTSKTTIVQLVAQALGSYVETTETRMWLAKSISANGHTDDIARLRGCRMVTADEFPKIGRFADDLIKKVTSGGAPMSASRKGEQGFTFNVHFGAFFSSNFDPYIAEDDEASIQRLTALTFKKKVEKINRDFVKNYLDHGDNAMAILKWCMDGAVDFLQHGFGEEPEEVRLSREEYKQEQVSIADQLQEIISVSKDLSEKLFVKDIKIALVEHQKATRQVVFFTDKQLAKVMLGLFDKESFRSTKGSRAYLGLKITDPKKKGYGGIDHGTTPDDDDEFIGGQMTVPFRKEGCGRAQA